MHTLKGNAASHANMIPSSCFAFAATPQVCIRWKVVNADIPPAALKVFRTAHFRSALTEDRDPHDQVKSRMQAYCLAFTGNMLSARTNTVVTSTM